MPRSGTEASLWQSVGWLRGCGMAGVMRWDWEGGWGVKEMVYEDDVRCVEG